MNGINLETQNQTLSIEALNNLLVDSIQDIKGQNILKLDLRQLDDAPTDFFIICEGESSVQVRSIAENIQKRLKQEEGILPSNLEGMQSAHWICLDYFYTVVHVFYHETREFYELEDLWSDADTTEYDNL
ncbi:MAG: ribosome silencing factor [Bacteroidota bacterium]